MYIANRDTRLPASTPSNRPRGSLRASRKLPTNFAERVLDLEADIESGKFNQNSIDELMELYSDAVEYYNSKQDKKFHYYEQKMQTLMTRPEIIAIAS